MGQTPLVELFSLAERATPEGTRMLAKAEHLNPGGSCKDRLAVALLDEAEANTDLQPGDPVVEATFVDASDPGGRPYIAYTDGCDACPEGEQSTDDLHRVAILERGPNLAGGVLEPLVDLDEAAERSSARVAG